MLEAEDKELMDKIMEHANRFATEYEAGRITEKEYQVVIDMLEDAEKKILAIFNRED